MASNPKAMVSARELLNALQRLRVGREPAFGAGRWINDLTLLERAIGELAVLREERDYLRPEVRGYARAMERWLRENDDAKGPDSWKAGSPRNLGYRVIEEGVELLEEVLGRPGHVGILNEAADVGNMAMMVADASGLLPAKIAESVRTHLRHEQIVEALDGLPMRPVREHPMATELAARLEQARLARNDGSDALALAMKALIDVVTRHGWTTIFGAPPTIQYEAMTAARRELREAFDRALIALDLPLGAGPTTDAEAERIGQQIVAYLRRIEGETGPWDIVQGELEEFGYRLEPA